MKLKSLKNNNSSLLKIACFWIFFGISTTSLFASNDFEGEITYHISYEDGIQEQILEVLPKQSTILIKDHRYYSYTSGPMGMQGLIYDNDKKESFTLIDLFTSALAIKKSEDDIVKDREFFKINNITHTEESKLILGYSCRKIIVSAYIPKLKENIDFEAFYTTSLGNNDWINEADPIYHQIKGTLLEYEIQMGSVFMKFKASKVEKRKLSDKDLRVPKTHKVVSTKEAESLLKNQ